MKNPKILVPVLLLLLGGVYKFVLAKPPAEAAPKPKVTGTVYVMPKDFLVNLEGGKFAKLGVALVIKHDPAHAAGGGGHGPAPEPPEGYGAEPQEALVRDIITDALTGLEADELTSKAGRKELKKHILEEIHHDTDVHAEDVLFTDVAVQ